MNPQRFPQCRNKRAKIGKRPDLENRFFRSSWEANYARYLNWMKDRKELSKWEYEPETFEFEGIKRGTRFYTPDFKITWPDGSIEYHEIKGYMDQRSRTKLQRMARYHPKVKVVLLDQQFYRDLKTKMARLIPNWE